MLFSVALGGYLGLVVCIFLSFYALWRNKDPVFKLPFYKSFSKAYMPRQLHIIIKNIKYIIGEKGVIRELYFQIYNYICFYPFG